MKRVLFDANVVLDVLLKREPWVKDAQALWQANDERRLVGYITASTVLDIFYVARKLAGLELAHQAAQVCLEAFEICVVDRLALEQAAALPGTDLEDNLQIVSADRAALDAIITRDSQGFKHSPVPALTPTEAVSRFESV